MLLPCCVDGARERTAREPRLCHNVVSLGDAERGLPQKVLGSSDVDRIPNRPEACSGMPEAMQVHRESESFLGASAHRVIYADGGHGSSFVGGPGGGVRISTGYSASEPLQIQIDAQA